MHKSGFAAHGPDLKPRDIAAAAVVVLIWGMNFVAMKIGLAHFTPFQLGAGRFALSLLPLALFLPFPAVPWKWLVAYGLTQGLGQFGLMLFALKLGMSTALASVLVQTQVFFTALLGMFLLRERLGTPLKWGMLFAALGLLTFGANLWLAQSQTVTGAGIVLTLAAAAMWALSNIVVRQAQLESEAFEPMSLVVWSSAIPIVPFLVLSWWLDGPESQSNWKDAPLVGWLALAALGWLATNVAYSLWTTLLKRFPASRVAPFSLAMPLIGIIAGIVLLDETVSPLQGLGAALIVGALLCVILGPRLQGR